MTPRPVYVPPPEREGREATSCWTAIVSTRGDLWSPTVAARDEAHATEKLQAIYPRCNVVSLYRLHPWAVHVTPFGGDQ